MPQQLAYAPQEAKALLSKSGFRSIETCIEANDIVYANLEDWWAFQLTLGPRAIIMAMNEGMREQFKQEYLAKLQPMLLEDGLHQSLTIVYAIAKR